VSSREHRVWHLLTCEYPPVVGGVSDYTSRMARSLADDGDEVHVWCPGRTVREDGDGVTVHAQLGRLGPTDLRRAGARLDGFPGPRRLLVQWVPHGFGYYSMNVWFCAWLAARAWSGDRVELMVHEPFLAFRPLPVRYLVIAVVHRLMTLILLAASTRVWVAIPAWERALRPYALGRRLRMDWLPIPSCILPSHAEAEADARGPDCEDRPVIGHFSSFGPHVVEMLEERLQSLLEQDPEPIVKLVGQGSEQCRDAFVRRHPTWAGRVHATGYVADRDLARCLEACDLFVQPYPDGITSRRTSAMACLSSGRPLVTTCGHLTEPLWAEAAAVAMASPSDVAGFTSMVAELMGSGEGRRELGDRGRRLCETRFSFQGVVAALRAA